MPGFLAPLLGTAASALAPAVIDALLERGVPEEFAGGKKLPGMSAKQFQKHYKDLMSHYKGDTKKVATSLGATFGKRKGVRAAKGPGLGSKALGYAGGAGTVLFLLQMLKPDLFMPSMEDMGLPPTSGDEGDIMDLLSGLQGAAESGVETRNEEARTRGMVNMLDRQDILGSQVRMGGTADLDELIRGSEDMLGKIAYREPMSLAQAYAMHGLYAPKEPTRLDFGDIM